LFRIFKFACLLVLPSAFVVVPGNAQVPGCTIAKANRAELEASRIRAWDALHKWYMTYRRCDDGSIAEGISEDVARILVDHWKTLPKLDELASEDARFKRFVIKHIDATLRGEDVEKIERNARMNCPAELTGICADLKKRARSTLKELAPPDANN